MLSSEHDDPAAIAGPSRPPRWSTLKNRFSQMPPRDSMPSPVSDHIDDGMWDNNDAAFLEEVAHDSTPSQEQQSPSALTASGSFSTPKSENPSTLHQGVDLGPSPINTSPTGTSMDPHFTTVRLLTPQQNDTAGSPTTVVPSPSLGFYESMDHTTSPLSQPASGSNTPPLKHERRHTKNRSSLVIGLRKLMGKRERDHKNGDDMVISSPIQTSPSQVLLSAELGSLIHGSPVASRVNSTTNPGMQKSASERVLGTAGTTGSFPVHGAESRAKSTDALSRPLCHNSGRFSRQSHQRQSTIEHISYDEARKTTSTNGPAAILSEEPTQLAIEPRPTLQTAFEAISLTHSTDSVPRRPSRRPHSIHSQALSVIPDQVTDVWTSSASSYAPPVPETRLHRQSLGMQGQYHIPFPREAASSRSPPSSPTMTHFNSQDAPFISLYTPKTSQPAQKHKGQPTRRSLNIVTSGKPWSAIMGSPTASSAASSSSHRITISRPMSLSSSAFSEQDDFGFDMHEHYDARNRVESSGTNASNLIGSINFGSLTSSSVSASDSRADHSGNSMGPLTASFLTQDPLMNRSRSSQAGPSSSRPGHRYTASGSSLYGHSKRPSFGLAISPDASLAFDSIPSPLLHSRRQSATQEVDNTVRAASIDSPSAERPIIHSSLPAGYASDGRESVLDRQQSDSVPLDEGDNHMQDRWSKGQQPRNYSIHSPAEEGDRVSDRRLGQATKDITFGSAAGMVSKVFEHPFDLVKVRLQTQPRYTGAIDCFKQTYLNEGIRGLYRGLSMPVIGATLENACLFFTYNQLQRAVRWWGGQATNASASKADADAPLTIPQLAFAAAGAGSVTSFVLTPIELIKCKMQVQMITQALPSNSTPAIAGVPKPPVSLLSQTTLAKKMDGPLALVKRTIAADGLRGLWLGQTGTLLRETGGSTAWFLAFESCSRYLIAQKKAAWNRSDVTKKDLSSLELVCAGALAGISYNVVLFPADSVKSTMQTEQEMKRGTNSGAKFKGTGFFATFNKIYATRGLRGLYAGLGVTCLRSAPSSAIIFLMYNKLEALSDAYGL